VYYYTNDTFARNGSVRPFNRLKTCSRCSNATYRCYTNLLENQWLILKAALNDMCEFTLAAPAAIFTSLIIHEVQEDARFPL
jgi:hypothetical protein